MTEFLLFVGFTVGLPVVIALWLIIDQTGEDNH